MYDTLQNIFLLAFAIVWFGRTIILFLRFRREQATYLRRFPPIDRYQTLDMYTPGFGPPGTQRRIYAAMLEHQSDPELEQLRREVWRRFRLYLLWLFGFPLVTFGLAALLIVLFIDPGIVHLT